MKTTEKTNQIATVLLSVVNLNDLAGNEKLHNFIDDLFLGFQSSMFGDEIDPKYRELMTLNYQNLKRLVNASNGLKMEDFDKSFPLNVSKYLIEKDLMDDYMKYCQDNKD
jgi:hypothetical protein